MTKTRSRELLVYVGTYTRGRSEGIYGYRMDVSSGRMDHLSTAKGIRNPSFLDIAPGCRQLCCVCEVDQVDGRPGGGVAAFAIDPRTGDLSLRNQQSSVGSGPCHLRVDKTGRYVLVANYGSGSVAILPILSDGRLGPATDHIPHQGSSAHPTRQKGPHAHSITPDPANRFAFAADLGLDQIRIYRLDLDGGRLRPHAPSHAQVKPGAGPRHFAFHPQATHAYLINELDNTIIAFAYHAEPGVLEEIQTVSTLPADFTGTSYCADIHVAPSGRFLYGSNRGHDSIAIFAIDPGTGRLTAIGHEPTQGKNPRNFAIDPTGTFLLAANQDTDTIVVFRIDSETGRLAPAGHVLDVPTPVCIQMMPL